MTVRFAREGHIAVITLDRPDKLNALTPAMFGELSEIWKEFRADRALRVAVVRGEGRSFCAGADLDVDNVLERDRYRDDFAADQTRFFGKLPEEGLTLWKPTIVAIHGHCIGAGMTLAAGMDIRICADDATFAFPEVCWGVPTITGAILLPQVMAAGAAAQMLFTGDAIDAAAALRTGFVNAVHERAELMDAAFHLAGRIADNSPVAVQGTKEAMRIGQQLPFHQAFVHGEYVRRVAYDSRDARIGLAAFSERSKPEYVGY